MFLGSTPCNKCTVQKNELHACVRDPNKRRLRSKHDFVTLYTLNNNNVGKPIGLAI